MSAMISRRAFAASVVAAPAAFAQVTSGPHFGSLDPQIEALAEASPMALSFLRPQFRDLSAWQPTARAKLFDLLQYAPKQVQADAHVRARVQRERDG